MLGCIVNKRITGSLCDCDACKETLKKKGDNLKGGRSRINLGYLHLNVLDIYLRLIQGYLRDSTREEC